MLDTQIYDLVVETSGMLDRLNQYSKEGKLEILTTHIQEDQLTNIPNDRKRAEIAKIIRQQLPTGAMVVGISRIGEARLGDGSRGGFGIDDFRPRTRKHSEDALIAVTAAIDADILVTEDRRFAKRMRALSHSCKVWGFDQLKHYVGF